MQDRNYIKMYCYLRCNKKQFEMTCVECDSLRAITTESRMLQTGFLVIMLKSNKQFLIHC